MKIYLLHNLDEKPQTLNSIKIFSRFESAIKYCEDFAEPPDFMDDYYTYKIDDDVVIAINIINDAREIKYRFLLISAEVEP